MLTFNLKKEWFEKIKSGEKAHEYREYKPYWITRISNYFNTTFDDVDLVLQLPRELKKPIAFKCGYKGETKNNCRKNRGFGTFCCESRSGAF